MLLGEDPERSAGNSQAKMVEVGSKRSVRYTARHVTILTVKDTPPTTEEAAKD